MVQTLSKILLNPSRGNSPQAENLPRTTGTGTTQEIPSSFKKFSIETAHYSSVIPLVSPAQHQALRRRVFGQLVRKVLNEKSHPLSSLDGEVKQDMINSITEELVQSHYKV